MKRVLIDVDDVAAQFRRGYLDTVMRIHGINIDMSTTLSSWDIDHTLQLTRQQLNAVWREINSPGWAQTLEPMPGVLEAVVNLSSRYEVMFVTKPLKSSDTWQSDRRKWVRKWFGPAMSENVVQTGKKYAVDGNWLIEDKPEHAEQWIADRMEHSRRRCQAILYAWPYNADSKFTRLPDWPSIVNYINRADHA